MTLEELYGTVDYSEKDEEEARKLGPDNFKDALHGLLAVKAGDECVVTRNVYDFACVNHLIKAKLPEQL